MEENILNKIKNGIKNTNCFFSLEELEHKIQNNYFEVIEDNMFLGLIEKTDYDFKYLYFYIENSREFKIDSLPEKCNLVMDVIFMLKKREKWNTIFTTFEKFGFKHYTSFNRMIMSKANGNNNLEFKNELVIQPKGKDFEAINLILQKNFDIYSERIPTIKELKNVNISIYCIKDKNEIVALLISDKKGVSEELRYWLVDENYRGKKYGSILMKYFLSKNKETKRFLLWVQHNNFNAIKKYEYFGFKKDNLINNIYLK